MFLTSKLITCFIEGFTSKRKSQSIAYLLHEIEQIYWNLDLANEVHSIWVIWKSGLQESMGEAGVGGWGQVGPFWCCPCPAQTCATLVGGM